MKNPIGILIYGYGKEDAFSIRAALDRALEESLFLVSGAGKEQWVVLDIRDKGPEDIFEEKEDKLVIFLAFNQDQIDTALRGFPEQGIRRPIFCGLTMQNMHWKLNTLIEHLKEEHRLWTRQARNSQEEP
ncbi:MAG TPA: DUF3783 domain-containing protein [Syntrophales bacterium]|nr:DUF3783 domain-containing protein [Syntrophales bacterium]